MTPERAISLQTGIRRLLRPQSIAIAGASPKPGSFGATVLNNLLVCSYPGAIHLINPNRTEIDGRPCVASVDHLPDGVDCAVLAIPKVGVLESVEACARRNVGSVIIFSAGFAESGEAGKTDQNAVARIARESGMAILGPNCLGMINAVDGVPLTFLATPRLQFKGKPGVGVVSQSGALAAVLGTTLRSHSIDLTFSISTGNEANTGIEDYVEYLLAEEHTPVIALLVEQFRNPRRFLALAQRVRAAGKHIVLLHPGRSGAARASAATHTGAIAGDYDVMRAKVAHAGVIIAETLEELVDISHILLRCPVLPRAGAAVLTESGAFKSLTLDLCEQVGLPLPDLSAASYTGLRQALPEFIPPSNPLDITAQALVDPELYRRTIPHLLADEAFGSVVLTIILTDESTVERKLPPILNAIASFDLKKPILFAGLDEGAPLSPLYAERLRELGVPFFHTAERVFRALARLSALDPDRGAEESVSTQSSPHLRSGVIAEYESKKLLAAAGIPIPAGDLAGTVEEALSIAARTGYPVVLKAQSESLAHKTEAGGVILDLRNPEELAAGWDQLHTNLQRSRPGLLLAGVLVEEMGQRGVELIVGARNDPDWGPVLLIGMGGIFAEALHDVRLLVPGLSADEILREMGQLKGAALLRAFRGAPAPDVSAVAEIVLRLGNFVTAHPEVTEIDLNPVVAYARGAIVLDALILTD